MQAEETVKRLHCENPDLHIIVLMLLRDGTIHPIITEGAQSHVGPIMAQVVLKGEDIPPSETTYLAASQVYEAIRRDRPVDYVLAITHQRNGSIAHSAPLGTFSARLLSDALMTTLR